jgi:anhydro-N-acetylmuramic acid kinase
MKIQEKREIIVTGIMTGNSVDAVDVATFQASIENDQVQHFEQISFSSSPCSSELRNSVFELKKKLKESHGKITDELCNPFSETSNLYHHEVNAAISSAHEKLRESHNLEVDLIGFHGQTLGHAPPSAMKNEQPYTIQMGDGHEIANTQKIVTVNDFRSDDVLNGGEGAPFAPGYNAVLTPILGVERAVYVNAGNTSNISIIDTATNDIRGWDCGPCNQFTDELMRKERGLLLDENGEIAKQGIVDTRLFEALWNRSVTTKNGLNGLEIRGHRSFDPQWYVLPQELHDTSVPFENRLRTINAFSAYCVAHSLALTFEGGYVPETVLLFGGGWKNPVLLEELYSLCGGHATYILPSHRDLFKNMHQCIKDPKKLIRSSDEAKLPSNGMEGGIFAFAALRRILEQPFTQPSFTDCKYPTICGAIHVPSSGAISSKLSDLSLHDQSGDFKEIRLSRASPDNQS